MILLIFTLVLIYIVYIFCITDILIAYTLRAVLVDAVNLHNLVTVLILISLIYRLEIFYHEHSMVLFCLFYIENS